MTTSDAETGMSIEYSSQSDLDSRIVQEDIEELDDD